MSDVELGFPISHFYPSSPGGGQHRGVSVWMRPQRVTQPMGLNTGSLVMGGGAGIGCMVGC